MPIPVFSTLGLDHLIGEDAGELRLDGVLLPGILQRMSIGGVLHVDRARMVSGAMRSQPIGFEVPTVRLTLALTSDPPGFFSGATQVANLIASGSLSDAEAENTCYGKAGLLERLHRAVGLDGNPIARRISNPHVNQRGIAEVWFTGLITSEAHGDVIMADVEFEQVEGPSFDDMRLAAVAGAPADLGGAAAALADDVVP